MMQANARLAALLCVAAAAFPPMAQAYLDPGTGSAILQGLIAVASAAMVAGHLYWDRLRSLLGLGRRKPEQPGTGDAPAPDDTRPKGPDAGSGHAPG